MHSRSVKVQVHFPRQYHRALKQYAALKGVTLNSMLTDAMQASLCREAADDLSLQGILDREGVQWAEDEGCG